MGLSIGENLSGLQESVSSLFRGSHLNYHEKKRQNEKREIKNIRIKQIITKKILRVKLCLILSVYCNSFLLRSDFLYIRHIFRIVDDIKVTFVR